MLQIFEMVKSLAVSVTDLTKQVGILVVQSNNTSRNRPATEGGNYSIERRVVY